MTNSSILEINIWQKIRIKRSHHFKNPEKAVKFWEYGKSMDHPNYPEYTVYIFGLLIVNVSDCFSINYRIPNIFSSTLIYLLLDLDFADYPTILPTNSWFSSWPLILLITYGRLECCTSAIALQCPLHDTRYLKHYVLKES